MTSQEGGRELPGSPSVRIFDAFYTQVYEELRIIAKSLKRRDPSATISSRALVDEAWLKLRKSPELAELAEDHFKAIAARAMRQVLVEAARRRHTQGRIHERSYITLSGIAARQVTTSRDVLALNEALNQLAELNPRQATMVEFRFFIGMDVAETATAMGVSKSVIERDWRAARAWLEVTVRGAMLPSSGDSESPKSTPRPGKSEGRDA
jgi:RNA polymerase sigma factor (TIGR02999 family)